MKSRRFQTVFSSHQNTKPSFSNSSKCEERFQKALFWFCPGVLVHKGITIVLSLLMFFATSSGKNTDRALPLFNILEMLTVANVYRLHALKFFHAWHKGVLPEPFNHFFHYASNVHNYNSRYAAKQNLHKF